MAQIKPEQFIRVWLEAIENRNNKEWVAETLGVPTHTVTNMAKALRDAGVELPPIRRTFAEGADIGQLNKLIREQLGS